MIQTMTEGKALSERQELFIELIADPENRMTMQQIANELEVGVRTLYRWKQQPEVQKKLLQKAKEQTLNLLPLANQTAQEILADQKSSATAKAKIISLVYQSAGLLLKDNFENVAKATERKPIDLEEVLHKYGITSPKPAEKVPHTGIEHVSVEEKLGAHKGRGY